MSIHIKMPHCWKSHSKAHFTSLVAVLVSQTVVGWFFVYDIQHPCRRILCSCVTRCLLSDLRLLFLRNRDLIASKHLKVQGFGNFEFLMLHSVYKEIQIQLLRVL